MPSFSLNYTNDKRRSLRIVNKERNHEVEFKSEIWLGHILAQTTLNLTDFYAL